MQVFLHKWVILVDDQGAFATLKENLWFSEAVRKVAESIINKGIQGLVFQTVCQKI